jgi:protocadherin delta 1
VHIRDENDNAPVFSQSEYRVELPEHPPPGTKVVQLKATDKDSTGNFGQIVYSSLIGSDAFHLDPETGEISVDKPDLLDREIEPGKQPPYHCRYQTIINVTVEYHKLSFKSLRY